MAVEILTTNRLIHMLQNIAYATPAKFANGYVQQAAAAALEVSANDTGPWLAIAADAEGSFFTGAPFIRTTAIGGVDIYFKHYI